MIESEGRYFGRKQGKSFQRLSRFQKLLFKPSKLFFKNIKNQTLVLEIGIGDGMKISEDASLNLNKTYIGCDIFIDGILRAARHQSEKNLKNLFVFYNNVQDLLPYISNSSLDTVRIYFPDPWPKTRHKKRRTFNKSLLKQLLPIMKAGSRLEFASDHGDYFLDALILISKSGFKILGNTPDMWQYSIFNAIGTKYEKKALDKNNKLFYFSALKR
jgi:tRNA (guanine-N7-)-methyltransferase|tara:strand:- start:233 stop:877 length:645 start_codon:yes stop_codon:yes gene_type:complete